MTLDNNFRQDIFHVEVHDECILDKKIQISWNKKKKSSSAISYITISHTISKEKLMNNDDCLSSGKMHILQEGCN